MHYKDMTPQQAFAALHRRANVALALSAVAVLLALAAFAVVVFATWEPMT